MKLARIVSDGTCHGTKIYDNNGCAVTLPITELHFHIKAGGGVNQVVATMEFVECDLKARCAQLDATDGHDGERV